MLQLPIELSAGSRDNEKNCSEEKQMWAGLRNQELNYHGLRKDILVTKILLACVNRCYYSPSQSDTQGVQNQSLQGT